MKRRILCALALFSVVALFFGLQYLVSWRAKSVLDYRRPRGTQNGLKQIGLGSFPATGIQIAPDESHLAVIRDQKLQVWRLHPARLVRESKSDEIANFAWAPDSQKLVVVQPSLSKSGEIWELNGETRVLEMKVWIFHGETNFRFSPDGQSMRIFSPSGEREWDLKSGKLRSQRHWKAPSASNWSPIIFLREGKIRFQYVNQSLVATDTQTRKMLWKNQTQDYPGFQISPRGESGAINQSPQITVMNARSGKTRWRQKISAHPQSLHFVFSADGRELIATDGEKFYVYNAQNGVLKRTLNGPPHGLSEMRAAPSNDAIYFLDSLGNVFRQRTR